MTSADWVSHLHQRWPDTEWRLMFHGTGHAFERFSEASIGRGRDANAALGVHLAEYPEAAAEYAEASVQDDQDGQHARVLVVALPARHPTQELNDFFKFFGEADAGVPGKVDPLDAKDATHFRQERARLRAAGHDVVDYEDGEQVITVALDPADLVIVGSLTPEAAFALRDAMENLADMFDAPARLTLLDTLATGWTPSEPPLTDEADVRAQVVAGHHRPTDLDEGDLLHRLDRFTHYRLVQMPLASLDLDEWATDSDRVTDYAHQTTVAPPIVVDPLDASIIDGTHRAQAARERGDTHLWAYVGASPNPDWRRDPEDALEEEEAPLAKLVTRRRRGP